MTAWRGSMGWSWSRWAACLTLGGSVLLAGCQSTQVAGNQPLPHAEGQSPDYSGGYRLSQVLNPPRGEVLAVMSFSGGGKRSAAFAHGALRGASKLAVREDAGELSLLDEVKIISGVSGGSFPAMHYGLYREKSFETFPNDFLYQDIEDYIYGIFVLPWNWEWLVNPFYGTNDRMSEIYDRLMFHGATYADLMKKGAPFISVNATDIAGGIPFPFTQPSFDLICSDLTSLPVARAVAASNGFPVLFTPITLTSYRRGCGAAIPPGTPKVSEQPEQGIFDRRAELAREAARYLDPDQTSYVHLMDGGISDNLALRTIVNTLFALDRSRAGFTALALRTRRIIVISVDGQAETDPTIGRNRVVTGLGQILSAVSGSQIDAYNFETMLVARERTRALVSEMKAARCAVAPTIAGHPCDDVQGDLIQLSLQQIQDEAVRARLRAIPTGLTIPKSDVDTLVSYGEKLILENQRIRDLLDTLEPPPPTQAAAQPKPGS